jgi:hypothetical protein
LVLLSPDAVQSMWVRRETAYALSGPRYENKIAPLQYRDCDLGRLAWLKLYRMTDFRGNFGVAMRELSRVWGLGLRC